MKSACCRVLTSLASNAEFTFLLNETTPSHVILWNASEGYEYEFMLPMGLTILDLSAYAGLIAVGAITLNMLLGLLMALRYSPHRSWPHHRFNYFRVHNWTGYIALAVAILHPAILLFNNEPRFRILDLLYPIHSPTQPLDNTIGAIALYLLAFIVITSYLRIRLGRHLWKSFHFSIYFAATALFWHSLFTDPDLKNSPVAWSDGGKLFVESCLLLIAAISLLRLRHARKKTLRARQTATSL